MKIIIVGCGKVGYAVAKALVEEKHDVTVIDSDKMRVENATNNVDVMGLAGNGASYKVLLEAGVQKADLLIALTQSDELNLFCCLIARKAGHCQTIARVTDPTYRSETAYIKQELGLAMTLNPEEMTAKVITRLCKVPTAMELETLAKGNVEILKVEIPEDCFLDHKMVMDVRKGFSNLLITAVERDGEVSIPGGDFMLKKGDRIAIVGEPKSSAAFIKKMGVPGFGKVRSAILIGAENMSEYVAKEMLRQGIHVKVFDADKDRCEHFSIEVPGAVVINADPSKPEVLLEEGLERADAFATLTKSDELNILLGIYAKSNANCKVVTLINHANYMDVAKTLNIGSLMSLQNISTDSIVQYVRAMKNSMGSNVEALHRIMDNKVDALEFLIKEGCSLCDTPISQLKLKRDKDLLISCINHMGKIEIPSGQSVIHEGDTVIIVTTQHGLNDIEDILK